MDTQTQIERLIELAVIQRSELKQLVEQLPQLRDYLTSEVEKVFDEVEPQIRSELEEFCDKRAVDANAKVGSALEVKIVELSKALEVTTQARFNAIKEQERKVEELRQLAAKQIEGHVAALPEAVKEIVGAELARFPRAGEIDQLRKEFAEPRGLNPRGKWLSSETYNRLDLVTYNGDSFTSAIDGNRSRPSRNAAEWTLIAARGTGGGGPTSLSELTTVPSNGDLLIGSGTSWVTSNLTAGAGISITVGAGEITISATDGDITLDDGTAASPSLHFTNDPDTGIYRPAANTLGISVSGTQVAYFDENGLTIPSAGVVAGGSFHAANGNANNPSHSFTTDQDTGFYRHASNQIGVSTSGTASLVFTENAGELLGHTGVSVTFGAGSSGATLALGQGTNGGVTITPKGSGTAVIAGTTIPTSKTLVVTTDKLSALAATTSSELAGVISDETGTGSLVFANTPTLVTPVLGAATGTSLSLTGNVTSPDHILGSSGPSVKSTLSARAPRQGLVYDGTAGTPVSVASALGQTWTIAAWINPANVTGIKLMVASATGNILYLDGATVWNHNDSTGASVSAGKTQLLVVSNNGGTATPYVNGIAGNSYTSTTSAGAPSYLGSNDASGNYWWNGFLSVLIYNRALSSSEVVALYEAGAPAKVDYPSQAAGTAIIPASQATFTSSTGWNLSLLPGSTIDTGAGTLTTVAGSGARYDTTDIYKGNVYRYQLTVTSNTGQLQIYDGANYQNIGTSGATGTLTVELLQINNYGALVKSSTGGAVITDFTCTSIGLLLAPDAYQAGGGLSWYDTSGNSATITLPASGVSWNVPTSGKIASALNITNTTDSSSKDTGCLILEGGLGVEKKATFGGGINGTTTNDSAAAGCVGEYVSSTVAPGSAVSLTNDAGANVTSISLTAGDWDVNGTVAFNAAGTTTVNYLAGAVSTTSLVIADPNISCTNHHGLTLIADERIALPTVRLTLTATTTVYLVVQCGFGTSTLKAYGQIRARRVR